MTRRIVVLASGSGTNLQAILDASADGSLDARVAAVYSNKPEAGALARASTHGVPAIAVTRAPGEGRPAYDHRLALLVAAHHPDYVVLAGWMLILSANFIDNVHCPVVNLHPALPGELPGVGAIERAHAEAVLGTRSRTGVMVHFVPDHGVDDGPVIATTEVAVNAGDSLHEFEERMHAAEHRVLIDALRVLCSHDDQRSMTSTATPTHATNREG